MIGNILIRVSPNSEISSFLCHESSWHFLLDHEFWTGLFWNLLLLSWAAGTGSVGCCFLLEKWKIIRESSLDWRMEIKLEIGARLEELKIEDWSWTHWRVKTYSWRHSSLSSLFWFFWVWTLLHSFGLQFTAFESWCWMLNDRTLKFIWNLCCFCISQQIQEGLKIVIFDLILKNCF